MSKTCPKCGTDNKDEALFCSKCGEKLAEESVTPEEKAEPVKTEPKKAKPKKVEKT